MSPSVELLDGTPPAKAKKGRKSKSSLVPPAPEGSISSSKPTSETSSITGEGLGMRTGEAFDGDGTVGDDISVLSLDEGQLSYFCSVLHLCRAILGPALDSCRGAVSLIWHMREI